jgi:hypothetical protein
MAADSSVDRVVGLNWELPTFAAEEVLARRGIRLKRHGGAVRRY